MATLDLFAQLESLKKERNTVILVHYYQVPDLQDNADCNCIGVSRAFTQLQPGLKLMQFFSVTFIFCVKQQRYLILGKG